MSNISVSSDSIHQRRRRIAGALLLLVAAIVAWMISSLGGGASPEFAGASFNNRLTRAGGTGNGSLMQARTSAETAGVNATLSRTPYIVKGGGEVREVALTFDDGPSEYTPKYLEILKREGVGATFFTVGGMYSTFGATATVARDDGFPVENHTFNHPQLPSLSAGDQASQIDRTTKLIEAAGIPSPELFRPPYGAYDAASLAATKKRGMLLVLWDVDTLDWSRPGVDAIVNAALSQAQSGSIILMHDGGGDRSQTLAALPQIIRGLRQRGFRMVTVPRLLTDDPPRAGETPPPSAPA